MKLREADVSSGLPQVTRQARGIPARAGKKRKPLKKKQREADRPQTLQVRLMESDPTDKPSRFRVTLIREGMGNFGDSYYYPGDVLAEAAPLFEGAKIFKNHPTEIEEEIQPERKVEDILGHFENVGVTSDANGCKVLEADVVILPGSAFDFARSLMQHAVEFSKKYPAKDFIGLSINASGQADPVSIEEVMSTAPEGARGKLQEASDMGITELRVVRQITEAQSCDLVTKPGAGGKVLRLLEKNKTSTKGDEMSTKVKSGKKVKAKESDAPAADPKAKKKAAAASDQADHADHDDDADDHEETHESDAGAVDTDDDADDGEGDDGSDDDHEDAQEDIALFKKLLAEYVDNEEPSDDDIAAAKEAHGHAMEAYDGKEKEAYEAAGHALKLAHHKEKKVAEAKKVLGHHEAHHEKEMAATGTKPAKPGHQESAKKPKSQEAQLKEAVGQNLKLAGENARLKAELSAHKVQAHLDQKLEESGLSRQATRIFREKAGEFKTVKEVDEKLALFVEAWNEGGRPTSLALVEGERHVPAASGSKDEGTTSLSDCVL